MVKPDEAAHPDVRHHRASFTVSFDTWGTEEQVRNSVAGIRAHLSVHLHRSVQVDNITVIPKFKIESA